MSDKNKTQTKPRLSMVDRLELQLKEAKEKELNRKLTAFGKKRIELVNLTTRADQLAARIDAAAVELEAMKEQLDDLNPYWEDKFYDGLGEPTILNVKAEEV